MARGAESGQIRSVHCKKRLLFPSRKSLISDIPAGEGEIANLFLQCGMVNIVHCTDTVKYSETASIYVKWGFLITILMI